MIKRFYSIYDTQARIYMNPIVAQNHADAIRLFTTFVNDKNKETTISRYPHQFILFHLFDMDDVLGRVGTLNETKNELIDKNEPRELIIGTACVEEENKKYTVKELITLMKVELQADNVINIADKVGVKDNV